ncbi:MAG: hypothetical protein ACOH2M_08990, partial [Cypionkella sp.]
MNDAPPPALPRRTGLPYGFARQHGVILEAGPEGPLCVTRPDCSLIAMIEMQRVAGLGLRFEPLSQALFDARLATAYR